MPTLREQLVGLTPDQRAVLKAQWFSEVPTRTFTRGVYSVTLSDLSVVGNVFSVFVVVVRNGSEVLRDTFQFVNPPVLVPDGTTHIETVTRPDGTVADISVPNYREDVVEALKQLLTEAIKRQLT